MPSPFSFFPTELIRSQLFSCSGVKFLSVKFLPSPPPPSTIKNHKHSSLQCWLLWHINKELFKGEVFVTALIPIDLSPCFKIIRRRDCIYSAQHNLTPSPQRGDCNCVDYWNGDILLSAYQQGYMALKCKMRETWERILNSNWFWKGFRVKWQLWLCWSWFMQFIYTSLHPLMPSHSTLRLD